MSFFFISLFMLLVFWRPQEWMFPFLYGYNILDAIFYLALLVFVLEWQERRLHFSPKAPQLYLLFGLWFACMMSHVANTYFGGLMMTILPTFKFCFFTFVLFCVLDRTSRLLLVARMFVFMAATMAVHAHLQQVRGYGFAGYPVVVDDKGPRSLFFGIFEDPNDLAQMFAISIPLCFVLFPRRRVLSTILGIALSALLIYGVMCTRSRGGQVGLVAVAGLFLLLAFPARWLPTLVVIGGIATLLLGPLAGAMMDDSAHDRVAFWGTATMAFKRKPLFGVGYGMIAEYIEKGRTPHSAFVMCYSELGVFGYWFWFSLLQLAAVGCWRTRIALRRIRTRRARELRFLTTMALISLVGYAATGYFLSRAFVYPAFFVFALCGAIPYVAQRLLPAGHPPLINVRKDLFVMCTIGSLASMVYIYLTIIMLNKAWMSY